MIQAITSALDDATCPVVSSRYSIVMATAKRARQIIDGDEPLVENEEDKKPLSIAVDEVFRGEVKILPEETNN